MERPPTRPPGPRDIPGGPSVRLPCRWYHGISGRYSQAITQPDTQPNTQPGSDQGDTQQPRTPRPGTQQPGSDQGDQGDTQKPGSDQGNTQKPGHPGQARSSQISSQGQKKAAPPRGRATHKTPDYDTRAETSDSSAEPERPSCNAPKMEV